VCPLGILNGSSIRNPDEPSLYLGELVSPPQWRYDTRVGKREMWHGFGIGGEAAHLGCLVRSPAHGIYGGSEPAQAEMGNPDPAW
jgi:hypothetical protein